jgi:outer membrane protein TolC
MLSPRPQEDYESFLEAWDWPIETLTPLPDVESAPETSWRRSLERAIEQRPELAQRRLEIDSAEVRLVQARSERLPLLDLDLTTSGVGFDADPQEAFDTAIGWDFPASTVALTFSLPIGNRTARYAERSARAAVRAAMLAYDRGELDVLADVRAAVDEVSYQKLSVSAAEESHRLAKRQFDAEQTRQNVGLSTTFQVLEFQQDLALARSTEVAARAAFAKALARLAHAEGRISDDLALAPGAAPGEGQR